jgi:uncharacterized protein HemX
MSNGNGNNVSKFTKWVKLVSYVVAVVVGIGGFMWAMETRYAKAEAVKEQFVANQIEIVQTFQLMQKQIEQSSKQQDAKVNQIIKQRDIRFYQRELRDLNAQHITIEKKLGAHPNNLVLQDERRRIIDSKKTMQQELNRLMR